MCIANAMERRLKVHHALGAVCAALLACASSSHAAQIQTTFSQVAANTWDVSFEVTANAGQTIEAFSVYFDWTKASNILVQASPGNWDSLAIQGDALLSSDGIFDSLPIGPGISAGTSLSGFAARFDWADTTAPAALRFTINDPVTFGVLEPGFTVMAAPVPEPAAWLLMLTALGAGATLRRTRPSAGAPA